MADDRRFSHPVPFGVMVLILLVTQGLAFLGRLVLARWGVEAPGWLAAGIGAATAVALVALISRKLAQTS